MISFYPEVEELKREQRANQAMIAWLEQDGEFEERFHARANDLLFPLVTGFMPVWTGTSKAAQRSESVPGALIIYTEPTAINPVTHNSPTQYLPGVFARRGSDPYTTAIELRLEDVMTLAGELIDVSPIVQA